MQQMFSLIYQEEAVEVRRQKMIYEVTRFFL